MSWFQTKKATSFFSQKVFSSVRFTYCTTIMWFVIRFFRENTVTITIFSTITVIDQKWRSRNFAIFRTVRQNRFFSCFQYTFPKLSKNYLLKQEFLDKSIDAFELLILLLVNAENFMSLWQVDHGKQNVLSRYKPPYNFHVTMSRLVFMKTVTFKML